ncbi:MAG: peptidase P60 [Alphaproteobacteria bacterium]|nr:peptidase P60 [Alphaproteobacteria bacterium]
MEDNFAARVIAAARACAGTPFHHQGRAPGAGLDCIGLVVVALRAAGKDVRDRTNYGRRPDGRGLVAALESHGFAPRADKNAQAGDILLFRFDSQPQHVALATGPGGMLHAYAPAGKVVEVTLSPAWRSRLLGVWSLHDGNREV